MTNETAYFIKPKFEEDKMDLILMIMVMSKVCLCGLALYKILLIVKNAINTSLRLSLNLVPVI
jgi:hypothetical protein